ncbi:helicase, partial [Clostridium butyricum]
MDYEFNSNEEMISTINKVLEDRKECTINIVNDKLTLSVFSLLETNLKNVKEINFIIRDISFIPTEREISREFEIESNSNDLLFNSYDIKEKNKLKHFREAKLMYDFIKKYVNVRKTLPGVQIKSNVLLIDNDFMIQGSSS